LNFKSSGLERVFGVLVKGLSITRLWVAILEKFESIGDSLKEKLGSPENWEVAGAETKSAKSRYYTMLLQANFYTILIAMQKYIRREGKNSILATGRPAGGEDTLLRRRVSHTRPSRERGKK